MYETELKDFCIKKCKIMCKVKDKMSKDKCEIKRFLDNLQIEEV